MRDPLLIDPQGQRIPDEWRRNFLLRPIERLPGDVLIAFDRIHTLQKEKDQLQSQLLETQGSLKQANLKIWIMSLIVSPILAAVAKAIWAKIFP